MEKVTSYCKVANYLLGTSATDRFIVEDDIVIMDFKLLGGQSAA